MVEITDEMVKAAAAIMYNRQAERLGYVYVNFTEVFQSLAADTLARWIGDARAALTAVAPLIAAQEREACAKVAKEGGNYIAAAAIRARGETP
jgi:hypothetical protein